MVFVLGFMWFITGWGMGARYKFSLDDEIQTDHLVGPKSVH